MKSKHSVFILTIWISLIFTNLAVSQSLKLNKMKQLDFMVGEWIGTSKSFENGKIKSEVSAYQEIAFDLEQYILVIKLNSETLQLHTIIYYDAQDNSYYYVPFSKRGTGIYPAELIDGQLIVKPNKTKRYIFSRTVDGGFTEYGEELKNGKWVKYFEDRFTDTK